MAKKPTERQSTDPTARPVLLTLQQVASYTGVPYMSLRKLVMGGHLHRVRLGDSKRTWVKRADVDRLIDRSTVTIDG